ncbi:hypothetical protein AAHA92_30883 [Salvia divinorum]|uniref:Uncharacterized protein n=1 Tax=Salvia divinorum TaxID=28513 RepID=A0ABD1FSE1_SALDI
MVQWNEPWLVCTEHELCWARGMVVEEVSTRWNRGEGHEAEQLRPAGDIVFLFTHPIYISLPAASATAPRRSWPPPSPPSPTAAAAPTRISSRGTLSFPAWSDSGLEVVLVGTKIWCLICRAQA